VPDIIQVGSSSKASDFNSERDRLDLGRGNNCDWKCSRVSSVLTTKWRSNTICYQR